MPFLAGAQEVIGWKVLTSCLESCTLERAFTETAAIFIGMRFLPDRAIRHRAVE